MKLPAWPTLQAPWFWPQRAQHAVCVVLALLSALLCAAWRDERDDMKAQRAQQERHQHTLSTLHSVQDKTRSLQQALAETKHAAGAQRPLANSPLSLPAHMQALKQQADVFQLQLTELTMQHAQSELLLKFDVQGRYASVWSWWQQVQAPFLGVQQFQMESAHGQTRLRGTWRWLLTSRSDNNTHSTPTSNNRTDTSSSDHAADAVQHTTLLTQHIGFDQAAWGQAQHWQAQQSPSYVRWVVPLLKHAPHVLEQFSLQQLRYEGSLAQAKRRMALVRVLNDANAAQPLALLQEGAFLGPDLGQLLAITPEYLWVREVVRNAQGEWAPRWVKLPLGRVLPVPQEEKHTP